LNAPTIDQLKAATPPTESLATFLLQLPSTMEAQIFYALVLGSAIGLVGHYLRLWLEGEIEGCLADYLFKQTPKRTVLAIFAIVTWSAGEIGLGLFTTETGQFVGWGLVILSGIKTGYAGDSLVNKGQRPQWSPEQRADAAAADRQGTPTPAR
jgi:hypothetical protein